MAGAVQLGNLKSPHRGRLHPVWRVLLYIIAFFVAIFIVPTSIFLIGVSLPFARSLLETSSVLPAHSFSLAWLLLFSIFQLAIIFLLTYLFRRFVDRLPFRSLGFARPTTWFAEGLMGFTLGCLAMVLIFAVEWAAGWVQVWVSLPERDAIPRLLGYFVTYVAVAVGEETMFRGYILHVLEEWPGPVGAMMLSSVIFSIFHGMNPGVTLLALVHLLFAGLIFAYGLLVTQRLWLPIGLHTAWNFFQGPVFGFPVSGVRSEGIFTVNAVGPHLLTGASFGPEGGLIGLLALAGCAFGIWFWNRRESVSLQAPSRTESA